MSFKPAPLIDARSAEDVANQARRLVQDYCGLNSVPDKGPIYALTQIFGQLSYRVIERLNKAPDKNFLAFLDFLGNRLQPAVPASAMLTFGLSAASSGRLLPAGTRAFAKPPAGAIEPVYFETSEDIWLAPFVLKEFILEIPGQPRKSNGQWINNQSQSSLELFDDINAAYYFGFELPKGAALLVGSPLVLYFDILGLSYRSESNSKAAVIKQLNWEYSSTNSSRWSSCVVDDHTQLLGASGKLVVITPADFSSQGITADENDPKYYWLKVTATKSDDQTNIAPTNILPKKLNWLAINTVAAYQHASITDEILGSSNGMANQSFSVFHRPVLPGQQLCVRENQFNAGANPNSVSDLDQWSPWEEVTDFLASAPDSRHYVLDSASGAVQFGDGAKGLIPPAGIRNIKMANYRYGGGVSGNVAAGSITNLWSPLADVVSVNNAAAAQGGADIETNESLLARAPKALRHKNRAMSASDYEDLALMASTDIARVRCVPLMDLADDPFSTEQTDYAKVLVGKVSIIVVPFSAEPQPMPTVALLEEVKRFISPKMSATAQLSVVGPLYLQITVTAELKIDQIEFQPSVEAQAKLAIQAFLHPLTGSNGRGWEFGRRPHESDFYGLLGQLQHVEYIKTITVATGSQYGNHNIEATNRFLIFAGTPIITAHVI